MPMSGGGGGGDGGGGWSQPTSATSGMARYDLSDGKKRTKFSLKPVGSIRPHKAKSKGKAFRLVPGTTQNHEVCKMNDNYQQMLEALRASVVSIIKAPADQQEGLLNKSFDEFGDALGEQIGADLTDAFEDGQTGNIRKFVGMEGDDPLSKGMNDVAELAMVLRSAESFLRSMKYNASGEHPTVSQVSVAAVADWIAIGGQILKMLVTETTGVGHEEPDGDEGEGEQFEDDVPSAEKIAEVATALKKAIEIAGARLAKADGEGEAPAEGGEAAPQNPLETIGRLAAAIMVQVEAMNEVISGEVPADGEGAAEAEGEGAAAPAAEDGAAADEGEGAAAETEGEGAAAPAAEGGEAAAEGEEEDEEKKAAAAKSGADATTLKKFEDLAARVDAMSADLKKKDEDNARLQAELAALKKRTPAPAKGALRVVGKEDDDNGLNKADADELRKEAERINSLPEDQRAVELIKVAQRSRS